MAFWYVHSWIFRGVHVGSLSTPLNGRNSINSLPSIVSCSGLIYSKKVWIAFGRTAIEGAMLRYLQSWIDQLRWQRLRPFQKLAEMLLDHLEGILNYCRTKVPLGVVEAVNGNIKALLRRGCGYKNLRYLLLKVQRMAAIKTEFVVFKKAA